MMVGSVEQKPEHAVIIVGVRGIQVVAELYQWNKCGGPEEAMPVIRIPLVVVVNLGLMNVLMEVTVSH